MGVDVNLWCLPADKPAEEIEVGRWYQWEPFLSLRNIGIAEVGKSRGSLMTAAEAITVCAEESHDARDQLATWITAHGPDVPVLWAHEEWTPEWMRKTAPVRWSGQLSA